MSFTIIDIETTGLSKHTDKITEIAAAKFENGEMVTFQTLVNPEVRIPRFITELTGITNQMVESAPTINQVLPHFIDFLGDDVFVAHNATFDFGFLDHNLQLHHNKEIENEVLCTRKLANRLLPDLPRKRLQDLCEQFDVVNNQAHRALGDVHATVKVFQNMIKMLHEREISNVHQIIEFERKPREQWFVYILECWDESLYIGITNNLNKRMTAHKNGVGSKYVRAKRFKKLLHAISVSDKSEAAQMEYHIKQLERNDKIMFFMRHVNLVF